MYLLKKIKLLSLKEIFQLSKFSIGSRLINNVSKTTVNTNLLLNDLIEREIHVTKKSEEITFDHSINQRNFTFSLNRKTSDSEVFKQIILQNEYESIINLFLSFNYTPEIIVDAGANIGLSTLYFSAFYPDCTVYALEPAEGTFKRLKKQVENNHLNNIHLFNKGLWNTETSLVGDFNFRDGQDWSFRLRDALPNEKPIFTTMTIESILKQVNSSFIDLIKIDIEGGETALFSLENDFSWLRMTKVIVIEIHDEFNIKHQIENILRENNFEITYDKDLTIGRNIDLLK